MRSSAHGRLFVRTLQGKQATGQRFRTRVTPEMGAQLNFREQAARAWLSSFILASRPRRSDMSADSSSRRRDPAPVTACAAERRTPVEPCPEMEVCSAASEARPEPDMLPSRDAFCCPLSDPSADDAAPGRAGGALVAQPAAEPPRDTLCRDGCGTATEVRDTEPPWWLVPARSDITDRGPGLA